eukprot:1155839-Pleurochrysis_carterae.AAC.4
MESEREEAGARGKGKGDEMEEVGANVIQNSQSCKQEGEGEARKVERKRQSREDTEERARELESEHKKIG